MLVTLQPCQVKLGTALLYGKMRERNKKPFRKSRCQQFFAILSLKESINSEPKLELALRKLEIMTHNTSMIFIGKVGLTVAKNNLKKMKFDEYNSIFILMEENIDNPKLVKKLRRGKYACIYYRDNHSHSRRYYELLLDYIKKHDYIISGDAIERTIIDQFVSKDMAHYLTEIHIPLKEQKNSMPFGFEQ